MSPGSPNCTVAWSCTNQMAGRRAIHRDVRRPVAVVVARHGDVAGQSPQHGSLALHEPGAGRRAKHRDVRRPVAVVVAGHGDVAGSPPLHRRLVLARTRRRSTADTPRCRSLPLPSKSPRYPPTSAVPSAIEVAERLRSRHRHVAGQPPQHRGLILHEPHAGRRPIHRAIRRPIAVVVAGHGDVAGEPPLHRRPDPCTNHWPVDGRYTATIGRPVAVVVAGHGDVARDAPTPPRPGSARTTGRSTADTPRRPSSRRRCSRRARGCHREAPTATGAWFRTNQTPVDGRNTARSVVAVAVVVAGHRDVAREPPLHRRLVPARTTRRSTADTPRDPLSHRRCSRRPPACRRAVPNCTVAWLCTNHSPVDGRYTARSLAQSPLKSARDRAQGRGAGRDDRQVPATGERADIPAYVVDDVEAPRAVRVQPVEGRRQRVWCRPGPESGTGRQAPAPETRHRCRSWSA